MARLGVGLSALVALVALLALPSTADAYSVKTTGSFSTLIRADPPVGSTERCTFLNVFQWAELPGAVSYTVTIDDTRGFGGTSTFPPYTADGEVEGFPPVGKGLHRQALDAGSGPAPCTGDSLGRWSLKKITANYCEAEPVVFGGARREEKCETQIVGTTTEPDGTPIPDVSISISGGGSTKTKNNGAYGSKVKAGRHTVSAPKGFCVSGIDKCTRSTSVEVKAGKTEPVSFVRAQSFSVSGTITDEFGRGMSGVRTSLTGSNSDTFTTGSDGKYRLEVDEPGTYELTAVGTGRSSGSPVGPYEIYYIRLDDGTPSTGTAADVTLGDTETSQTVDWELDRRLQFKAELDALGRITADGTGHYPFSIRATTQRGDPAKNVQLTIDPDTDATPRAVICTVGDASRPLWPTVDGLGTISTLGLPSAETITDGDGKVSFDLFPGTDAGGFNISGGRTGDAGSTFFETVIFSAASTASFDMEKARQGLQALAPRTSNIGNQETILAAVAAERTSGDFFGTDAVSVTAGGKRGLAFFKMGSPPVEGPGGTLAPSGNIFVFDDALFGLPQPVPALPTLTDWAAGQPITIVRTDPRTFLRWPLPTITEGGLGTCLQGNPGSTMSFSAHSPAHLTLTDSQGSKIGFDSKGNQIDQAAGVSKQVDGDDFVAIPTGDYKLSVVGTGNGPVTLEARSGGAVSIAQFKASKGEKATLKVSGGSILPPSFKFDGDKVRSVDGVPLEVRGLPRKLRAGKKDKIKLKVEDAFGDPVPFPVLKGAGAVGSVTAFGDVNGVITTTLRPRKAGKAKLTISAPDLLSDKATVRVLGG